MATVTKPSPAFARIARRLDAIELMNEDGASELSFTARDFADRNFHGAAEDGPFLDFYSPAGLRRAFEAYGIDEKLRQKGLSDYAFVTSKDDGRHHRLQVFLNREDAAHDGDGPVLRQDADRIMDLRVHLVSGNVGDLEHVPLFVVEWLSMQNPRAEFSVERPRLPGQRFPSTGFGRDTFNLLIIAAQRLKRHALIHVPERFHLAELYHRGGSRYVDERFEQKFDAIYDATKHLSFCHRAWAVERGFVKTVDGTGASRTEDDRSVRMPAQEMVLPLSKEVASHVDERGFFKRLLDKATAPKLEFDRKGYVQSLIDDPVEGLEPL